MKSKTVSEEDYLKLKEENVRLKKSIQDLWTINELARIISSTMPVNQILDKVVSVSVKAIGAQQGTISLLDKEETQDPFKTLIRKVDQTTFTSKYRLDKALSGWMIKHRKPLLINDFKKNDTFKSEHPTVKDVYSILSVPLLCKGDLIGVLSLFNKKTGSGFDNDDQRLLSIIASQSSQVIENARLYEEEKQLRQIEQELEMARLIQNQLLPKEIPNIAGFDLAGMSYAAKEVGGDYFDFIELENSRWGIALGDVSGKGIPAALLMSNMQATLRNQAITNSTLVGCMEKTNNFLYRSTESNKFATLFFGSLDAKTKTFEYVNAGHNFPFHLDKKNEFHPLETGGLVMGMIPDCRFEQGTVKLETGDLIIIYSDGATEAENNFEEMYGDKRLRDIVLQNRSLSSAKLIEKIYAAVKDFEGGKKQDDDITLVVIKAN